MRIFKTADFGKLAKKLRITDVALTRTFEDFEHCIGSVPLGGWLYKSRIPRSNEGKSGGYRSIIAVQRDNKAIFLYVFAKNHSANITQQQLKEFKEFAKLILSLTSAEFDSAMKKGIFIEVKRDG